MYDWWRKKTKKISEKLNKQGLNIEQGPITGFFNFVFWVMQILSPSNWFFGTRSVAQIDASFLPEIEKNNFHRKRGSNIDIFIIIFWILLITLLLFITKCTSFRLIGICFSIWSIANVLQLTINMVLFDDLRIKSQNINQSHLTLSKPRTLILLLLNFLELIIAFGIIYFCFDLIRSNDPICPHISYESTSPSLQNCIYFSTITQLTIGYGDFLPNNGWGQIITMFQGFCGFIFIVLVLARLVSSMSSINEVDKKT